MTDDDTSAVAYVTVQMVSLLTVADLLLWQFQSIDAFNKSRILNIVSLWRIKYREEDNSKSPKRCTICHVLSYLSHVMKGSDWMPCKQPTNQLQQYNATHWRLMYTTLTTISNYVMQIMVTFCRFLQSNRCLLTLVNAAAFQLMQSINANVRIHDWTSG